MSETARARFVEAMRQIVAIVTDAGYEQGAERLIELRQAVEAFADLMSHYAPGALTPNELIEGPEFTRASLLKACGL